MEILQKGIDKLYSPETETRKQAITVLRELTHPFRNFLINMTSQMSDDQAMAMMAEIDHRLKYEPGGFKLDYDVSPTGKSNAPYDFGVEFGDAECGTVRIIVNSLSN